MISLFWVKSSKISIQGAVYIFGKNFQGSANKSKRFMLVIRFCKVSFFFPRDRIVLGSIPGGMSQTTILSWTYLFEKVGRPYPCMDKKWNNPILPIFDWWGNI